MAGPQYRSRFGDTTFTKVFVGGLAWETTDDELRHYFEHFGEILEAVIITDKNTGRSKGYGFVTFRDPESARNACDDPNPVIDGRRANCNIASQGRPRPSPPRAGSPYHGAPPAAAAPPYTRMPAHMSPLPPLIYPPYGYVGYTSDYGYQQALYNQQLAQYYGPQVYGPSSWSSVVGPPYQYTSTPQVGYAVPGAPRAGFPSAATRPPAQRLHGGPLPYQYPMPSAAVPPPGEASSFFTQAATSSRPYSFQLQSPPTTRQQPPNTADSQAPDQQPGTNSTETSGA